MATTTPKAKGEMDLLDRQILNIVQSAFPLVPYPYQAIGERVGISAEEALERLARLKKRNVVRQISAIFDTRRLGYKTTLVAFAYPYERLHKAALHINRHPGVSHNYARENSHYNLWFTLAVPPSESLEDTIQRMAQETQAESARIMPTLRFFKIGVNFDMVQEEGAAYDYYRPDAYSPSPASGDGQDQDAWKRVVSLSEFDKEAIRELQEDLPLESRPFLAMAQRLGMSEEDLFRIAEEFQERGVMRRYSAILHHRRAGFKDNAMGVWRVPEERAQEVGEIMAASPWVTHCYQRPTFPDWPYTHFTMIHATSREKCEEVIQGISLQIGITDYTLLYSTREYKKTRVRYFI